MKCPVCGQVYARPESVKACLVWHRAQDLAQTQARLSTNRRDSAGPGFIRKVVTK